MFGYLNLFSYLCNVKQTMRIMAREKKYFKKLSDARKALAERKKARTDIDIYKMSKGTRHSGEYAVCSYMEWLNTY